MTNDAGPARFRLGGDGPTGRLGTGLRTVETQVAAIFSKLGLEPAENDNRRVLAVVTGLRSAA